MTHREYKKMINDAVAEYCNTGGSLLNIALNKTVKEYIFEFDDMLSEDAKENLIDKAHQAIQKKEDLPPGVQLIKMVFK